MTEIGAIYNDDGKRVARYVPKREPSKAPADDLPCICDCGAPIDCGHCGDCDDCTHDHETSQS